MMCANPFRAPHGVFGCGQCMPCRINRRRLWTARICLEAGLHDQSAFVTLTYRKESNPVTLVPKHMQLFMKRLRDLYPRPLRFYGVGEYGDKSWRPHFHLAIFGLSMFEHTLDFRTGFVNSGPAFEAWPHGGVHVGELNPTSAHYIAGYVTKKLTDKNDVKLKQGDWTLHPEFARMSLKPGIGHGAVKNIAQNLTTLGGSSALARGEDVPTEVRINGKKYPIGRYLRRALRQEVGWGAETPDEVLIRLKIESAYMPDEQRWEMERRRSTINASAIARSKLYGSTKTL